VWENEEEEQVRKEKLRHDLKRVAVVLTAREESSNNESGSSSTTSPDVLDGDSSDQCILGLEDKIGERKQEKIQHREKAWDAVLWEQHNQWEEQKDCDYDVVAKVYSEGARTSEVQLRAQEVARRLEAEMQALRDEPEVMELLSQSNHSASSHVSCQRSCLSASSSCHGSVVLEDEEDDDDLPALLSQTSSQRISFYVRRRRLR